MGRGWPGKPSASAPITPKPASALPKEPQGYLRPASPGPSRLPGVGGPPFSVRPSANSPYSFDEPHLRMFTNYLLFQSLIYPQGTHFYPILTDTPQVLHSP